MSKKIRTILLVVLAILLVGELVFLVVRNLTTTPTEPPTEASTEASTQTPAEAPTEAATEAPTEPPTEAPTEPPLPYENPLTGEPLVEPVTTRIFAVTINNVPKALPHVGADQADILFEMYINGYATRGLALYSDIRNVETIGSVRSTRFNFTDLGIAYDAIVAHAGGSKSVISDANKSDVDHFNIDTSSSTSYSFRDKERKSAGYSWEHCLFVKGPGLYEKMAEKGYKVTQEEGKTYGLNFTEDGTPADGEAAALINIDFILNGHSKLTTMTYEEATGRYVYTQYGKTIDDVTEESKETFKNVFALKANVTNKSASNVTYHVADLDGSGEGYYACGGKIIPIQWHHEKADEPITFTLTDGTPLEQGIGNSYIAIVPLKSEIIWE